MRTREKGYEDYGFSDKDEARRLIHFCRKSTFPYSAQLMICAQQSNGAIANDIYRTITQKMSYADISAYKRIPISERDFYGYRRKTLGKMREWLTGMGIKY